MSVAVIHQYEKNNDAAADFDVMHAETKQLQKMSLSDPQEQNKENDLVGSENNVLERLKGLFGTFYEPFPIDVHKKLCSYNLPSGSTMPWELALSSRICYVWSTRAFGMQLGLKSTIMGQYGIGSAQL
ncbi:hypothetical protein Tco_0122539 [Tanacetum coccineum]